MENTDVNIKNWKSLIKPTKLDIESNSEKTYAKIVAEPLEKGYGLTLGNALRRILLSSIRGAAVTAIQIDGVLHEFSSIKGVREDVTDIVLNVKSLAIKSTSKSAKKIILDVKGPKEVKAKDITLVPEIEILNPEQTICNLDEKTNFHMELFVNSGKGYVPAPKNRSEDSPLGLISIDSLFSPVKKVSFSVENTRAGSALDYDKLVMTVETNGTIAAYASMGNIEPTLPFYDFMFKGIKINTFLIYSICKKDRKLLIEGMTKALNDNALKHLIASSFSLNEVIDAHKEVESNKSLGNIIINI